jgi:predicted NBD/HSP70 family sugar kinase
VRAINDRVALELLLQHGTLSRTQLVGLTGLSKPTAADLLSRLIADGLVVARGTTTGARGPNAQLYAVNRELGFVAGVSAEDERVSAAVADLTGEVIGEAALEVDLIGGARPVPAVRDVVRRATRRARKPLASLVHIVVGVSGSYDPASDSVMYAGHQGWAAEGVLGELRRALGTSVAVENDANLAAVSETTRGQATNVDTFALLWVGRGLGLAVDLGGRLYRGATGGAGEVGYLPVGGRSLTFQDSVGSGAVLELARRHGLVGTSAEAVVAAAVEAGEESMPFLEELAERIATGVATIVAVLDPPLLVLTGETCRAGGDLLVRLTAAKLAHLSPFRTPLVVTSVADNPVLAGAVDLAVAAGRTQVFGAPASDPWRPTPPSRVVSEPDTSHGRAG